MEKAKRILSERALFVFFPDMSAYPKYCEKCGVRLTEMYNIDYNHFSPDTGEPDEVEVRLMYYCIDEYGNYTGHYDETIDNYMMVRDISDKWKRKNIER